MEEWRALEQKKTKKKISRRCRSFDFRYHAIAHSLAKKKKRRSQSCAMFRSCTLRRPFWIPPVTTWRWCNKSTGYRYCVSVSGTRRFQRRHHNGARLCHKRISAISPRFGTRRGARKRTKAKPFFFVRTGPVLQAARGDEQREEPRAVSDREDGGLRVRSAGLLATHLRGGTTLLTRQARDSTMLLTRTRQGAK